MREKPVVKVLIEVDAETRSEAEDTVYYALQYRRHPSISDWSIVPTDAPTER